MKIVIAAALSLVFALPGTGNAQKKFNPNDLTLRQQNEFFGIVTECAGVAADANSTSDAATAQATACTLNAMGKSATLKGVKLPDDFKVHVIAAFGQSAPDQGAAPMPISCPAPSAAIPT